MATQIYNVLLSLLEFHAPSAAIIKPTAEVQEDGENAAPKKKFSSSTLRVVPQLLLGGKTTPAEDLSHFLKQSPNVLVSTPGRLLELLSSPHVHCPQSSFEMLILDEADRLLDLGFKEDLQKILNRLPKQRRTGLFSASISEAVDQIVRVGLRNPVKVAVKVRGANGQEEKRTPASLQMAYVLAKASEKFPIVSSILTALDPTPQKTILYLSTCAAVDYFQTMLPLILPPGFQLTTLHGKHPANVRQKNFTRFVDSLEPSVLLTTDVAARGLDIPTVDLVIQIDPPTDPKAFLHRCGRAGRAGRKGLAIILLEPGREEDYIPFLAIRKTPIGPLTSPEITSPTPETCSAITSKIRALALKDRALHDKAQRAFVSWVRAYSKHQASSIFRIADQDWSDLASAWGLLRLPRMPEAKKWEGDRDLGLSIDWDNYTYKDKAREANRLEALRTAPPPKPAFKKPKPELSENSAWSATLEKKGEREKRREKKGRKREALEAEKMTEEEREKKRVTEAMVEEIRKANLKERMEKMGGGKKKELNEDEWEGFSD